MWRVQSCAQLRKVAIHWKRRDISWAYNFWEGYWRSKVKGVRSFLGCACFYWRFITGFPQNWTPIMKTAQKGIRIWFGWCLSENILRFEGKDCFHTDYYFAVLRAPFMVICDASGVALGVILGQRREKILHLIHNDRKAINMA